MTDSTVLVEISASQDLMVWELSPHPIPAVGESSGAIG